MVHIEALKWKWGGKKESKTEAVIKIDVWNCDSEHFGYGKMKKGCYIASEKGTHQIGINIIFLYTSVLDICV